MKFSLITVTMGDRPAELQRLKDSLSRQTFCDFEHIVIDQRDHPEFGGGLAKARNFGLALAKGDVVAFPDDDAWYGPETLSDAAAALSDEKIDGISFRVVDETGACSAGGWMSTGRKMMTRATIWHTAVSCSFFVKRKALDDARFDERLGAGSGTHFGSGEDTDFLLSLIEHGARIHYDGSKCVFHPRVTGCVALTRGWRYGNGYGAILRKHHYGLVRPVWGVCVQLARACQAVLSLRFPKTGFHLAMAGGRACGYLFGLNERGPKNGDQALIMV